MIHVGLIGLGGIMRGAHAPGIKASGAFEIAAVCDINREALDTFGEAYDIPPERRFTDYRDLIACP
ncbi:MAG: Gfo/Idh/MocA family oxidoreductase, partial [Lentisphaerae bacterium]|nr:Gfo/Idh/MocA family oxidoreductase [Lentisphaerota bacterium]